jgi:hypothetical protein
MVQPSLRDAFCFYLYPALKHWAKLKPSRWDEIQNQVARWDEIENQIARWDEIQKKCGVGFCRTLRLGGSARDKQLVCFPSRPCAKPYPTPSHAKAQGRKERQPL